LPSVRERKKKRACGLREEMWFRRAFSGKRGWSPENLLCEGKALCSISVYPEGRGLLPAYLEKKEQVGSVSEERKSASATADGYENSCSA